VLDEGNNDHNVYSVFERVVLMLIEFGRSRQADDGRSHADDSRAFAKLLEFSPVERDYLENAIRDVYDQRWDDFCINMFDLCKMALGDKTKYVSHQCHLNGFGDD
jgi:hypothetical protein